MTIVYSYSFPRTDSADLPGDYSRCHRQEAEAIWSPRCGPDLTRGWETTLGALPMTFQFILGVGEDGIRNGKRPAQPHIYCNRGSWLEERRFPE